MGHLYHLDGRIFHHKGPVWNVSTDALSKVGFRAHWDHGYTCGLWEGGDPRCEHEFTPPRETFDDHINEKELWPVVGSLV